MKIIRIAKEISNYFYIGNKIKKNRNTIKWEKFKLRVGYFNVIYCVVNVPPEVLEGEEELYKTYVIEQLMPINEYLASLNLQEVVHLELEKVEDHDEDGYYVAFIAKYVPIFEDFTVMWVVKWFVISSMLFAAWRFEIKYGYLDRVISQLTSFF